MLLNDLERFLFLQSMDASIEQVRGLKVMVAGLIALAPPGTDADACARAVYRYACDLVLSMERERTRLAPDDEGESPVQEADPAQHQAMVH